MSLPDDPDVRRAPAPTCTTLLAVITASLLAAAGLASALGELEAEVAPLLRDAAAVSGAALLASSAAATCEAAAAVVVFLPWSVVGL